jgi:hypothetical protein
MAQAVSHRPPTAEARVRSIRFIPPVLQYLEKWKKKLIIFITGLHNKPEGCGAPVASAAGPFTTKKNRLFSLFQDVIPEFDCICITIFLTLLFVLVITVWGSLSRPYWRWLTDTLRQTSPMTFTNNHVFPFDSNSPIYCFGRFQTDVFEMMESLRRKMRRNEFNHINLTLSIPLCI